MMKLAKKLGAIGFVCGTSCTQRTANMLVWQQNGKKCQQLSAAAAHRPTMQMERKLWLQARMQTKNMENEVFCSDLQLHYHSFVPRKDSMFCHQ
jgi:hypothetical protein